MSTNNYVECRLSPVYSNHKMTAMTLLAPGGTSSSPSLSSSKICEHLCCININHRSNQAQQITLFNSTLFHKIDTKNRTGHFDTAAKKRRCEMLTFIKNHVTLRAIQSVRGKQEKSQVINPLCHKGLSVYKPISSFQVWLHQASVSLCSDPVGQILLQFVGGSECLDMAIVISRASNQISANVQFDTTL